MKPSDFDHQAQVFKALAHPARLLLIEALADGEQCVCDLTELVGSDMSTVSRHLAQLRQVGLVTSEKQGQMVLYRLACPCVVEFIRCVERSSRSCQPIQLTR